MRYRNRGDGRRYGCRGVARRVPLEPLIGPYGRADVSIRGDAMRLWCSWSCMRPQAEAEALQRHVIVRIGRAVVELQP